MGRGVTIDAPREVCDDLFQSILIPDDHAVKIDNALVNPFPTLSHSGHEGSTSDLSEKHGLDIWVD